MSPTASDTRNVSVRAGPTEGIGAAPGAIALDDTIVALCMRGGKGGYARPGMHVMCGAQTATMEGGKLKTHTIVRVVHMHAERPPRCCRQIGGIQYDTGHERRDVRKANGPVHLARNVAARSHVHPHTHTHSSTLSMSFCDEARLSEYTPTSHEHKKKADKCSIVASAIREVQVQKHTR